MPSAACDTNSQFTVPETNQQVTATAKVTSSQGFTVGEEVQIEFDPRRPEETVRIESGLTVLDIGIGLIGLALIYFGASEKWRWMKLSKGGT